MPSRSGSYVPERARATKVLSVRVPPQVRAALDAQATAWGTTRNNAFIRMVIEFTGTSVPPAKPSKRSPLTSNAQHVAVGLPPSTPAGERCCWESKRLAPMTKPLKFKHDLSDTANTSRWCRGDTFSVGSTVTLLRELLFLAESLGETALRCRGDRP